MVGAVGCLLFAMVPAVWGQVSDQLPMATGVLTNIGEIWTMSHEHRNEEYRIRTEVVIYYFDAEWGNAWGECMGNPRWLPIDASPIALKAGQRVAIDGVIVPQRERFVWAKTKIRILEENVELKAETVSDLGKNPQELRDHLVSVSGLIDRELDDPTHCTINFLSDRKSVV